ncbi:SH3 domain-containing protein [Lysinibacillus sp. NPDC097162]|uniref:SH3 domain-containing protein n=1 Tax=unclassified Lysinibacillus TaxID=2636778 RepID=UPI0037F15C81
MNIIKKWLVAVFVLLILFSFQHQVAEAADYRTVKIVSGSSLIVRDSPNDTANSIGNLDKDQFVIEFSSSNGWSHIQAGEVKGYVSSSFLSTPPSTIKIANSKSGLVVKSMPSLSASTLATLKYNMVVEDYGSVGDGWSFVQYGNVVGYVKSDFMGQTKTTTKYVNTNSGVVVRNIASQSGASVGSLSNGTQVTVHATLVGWSYVTANNVKGYVVDSYLSTKKPVVPFNNINFNLSIKDVEKNEKSKFIQKLQDGRETFLIYETMKYGYYAELTYIFLGGQLEYITYNFFPEENSFHTWDQMSTIHDLLHRQGVAEFGNDYQFSYEKYSALYTGWEKSGYAVLIAVDDKNLYTTAKLIYYRK